MKILSFPSYSQKTSLPQLNKLNYTYPQDTVSFSAMKKSAFLGIDLACVNLFKLPIEKFNSHEDFNKYVNTKLNELYSKYFEAETYPATETREEYLKSWKNALKEEPYSSQLALAYIVYSSITKDLNLNNKNMPPFFKKEVFEKTVEDMKKRFSENVKSGYDFSKNYDKNLREYFNLPKTGWVHIPSFLSDKENSSNNFYKLKAVSLPSWCTKNEKTEEYMYNNNFHIYIENDETKICIKEKDGVISEIQGRLNNSKIPFEFVDVVKDYVDKNNLADNSYILQNSIADKEERDKILTDISDAISNFDRKKIYDYFGIVMSDNPDGTYTLSSYRQPSKNITFKNLGIDEARLFDGVTKITGDAIFEDSSLTDLGQLKEIGRHCSLKNSLFKTTGNLEKVGSLTCSSKHLKEITNLKEIKYSADFSGSTLESMGSIEKVYGDLFIKGSNIKNLGSLKYVGGDFYGWSDTLVKSDNLVVACEKR